ncbi:MAG TPA: glutaredoxin domain-containing protein [Anaerolineales bacterium]|nr:glutaredoxin domain-containing protein [Anaerolineales bacterium]
MDTSSLYTLHPEQIVMYTTKYCGDCRMAKAFLQQKDIEYLEINVEGDSQATAFVKELNRGYVSVPTIIFPDGSMLVEPSVQELNEKFSAS